MNKIESQIRLNLGCGSAILEGWVNCDIAPLPGVDVIWDLSKFPWPFENNQFEKIRIKDVLEHLSDTVKVMEEIYRISKPGAEIYIAVPYWNCWEAITDPTHKRLFNEYTFEFFDPRYRRCRTRPYYTKARFKLIKQGYFFAPFRPWINIPLLSKGRIVFNPFCKKILQILASYFNNIIVGLEIYLERI